MDKKILIIASIFLILLSACSTPLPVSEYEQNLSVRTIAQGLQHPWGMAFINESAVLVTQRTGTLSLINIPSGDQTTIQGVPEVAVVGQGGLLDVFLEEPYIYLTYSAPFETGVTTHLGRGIFENNTIQDFEVLYQAYPALPGGAHFGSRVIVQGDYVFFTVGDRGDKNFGTEHVSQNTNNTLGATIRLYKNGSIPQDNPFVNNQSVRDSIYTFGHRNVQGMTIHPETGEIWQSEHGEQDGDEINILQASGNYGWPLTHYGCTYGLGRTIGEFAHEKDDIINPVYYWECRSGGFPPAGMTFYSGERFPEWQGDLFVGNLAGQYLGHFRIINDTLEELNPLLANRGWRIRDVQESPDGYLYVLQDANPGGLHRLE